MNNRLFILPFYLFALIQIFFVSCSTTSGNKIRSTNNGTVIIDMEVDKLGNYYLTDNQNNIKKYDKDQKLKYSYSNNQYGKPEMIDVINPHKILIFYKQQQTLVFLDNTLTEISILTLDPNSFYAAAGMANDGNIWLFDSYYKKLVKIDFKGVQIEESFPYEMIVPEKISGNKIIERDNYVMIVDENDDVFLFSNQAYFIKKIHLPGLSKPTILKNKIYYFNKTNNSYMSYDLKYGEATGIYDFKDIKPLLVIYENNKFYILTGNKVSVIPLLNE